MEDLGSYTPDEFLERMYLVQRRLLMNSNAGAVSRKQAYLLGGQSGAGKTTLHNILRRRLKENAVVINGDEYRSYHPRYREIDERYGIEGVSHTAMWSGKMTEALIDLFSKQGYNLVIEGTLRTEEVPRKTTHLLQSRGYKVGLVLMAVKPEISLISCQLRYEQLKAAGTIPRAVDPKHHEKIVDNIVNTLGTLEGEGLFETIELFNRRGECLYPMRNETRSAAQALQSVLFGDWSAEERSHYRELQNQLAKFVC